MDIEQQRITDVQLVMREKDAMETVGKELITVAKEYPAEIDETAFRNKALEFIKHITNLAGFCDDRSRAAIHALVAEFSAMIIDPNRFELFTSIKVKALVPLAIGLQVDFNKKPFRLVNFSVEALGAKVKAVLKR